MPDSVQQRLMHLPWLVLLMQAGAAQGLGPPSAPAENPTTPEKADLGQALFWDEQLSSNRTVACGTCHIPGSGGIDPRSGPGHDASRMPGPDFTWGTIDDIFGSPGVTRHYSDGTYEADPVFGFGVQPQVTPRRASSMIMAAYATELRWDGFVGESFLDPETGEVLIRRGAALEAQSLRPLRSPVEMAHRSRTLAEIEERIATSVPLALATDVPADLAAWIDGRDYRALFHEVFGSVGVTAERTAMALAAYQRTLVPDQAPIDDFLNGDAAALRPVEQHGWAVFQSAGCVLCHPPPTFTDQQFHYVGVRPTGEDRGHFYATLDTNDLGKMRTPSLRNVALHGAFLHNGATGSLEGAVEFFDRGGDYGSPNKSPLVIPLGLSAADKDAIVAFLGRPLTDPRVQAELPPFDRPTLYSESSHVPTISGSGLAGTGGLTPRIAAYEPPSVAHRSVTIGIDRGQAGSPAMLVLSLPAQGLGQAGFASPDYVVGSRVIVLSPSSLGPGYGSTSLALPDSDPAHVGTTVELYWRVADPGAPRGWSATPTAQLVWF